MFSNHTCLTRRRSNLYVTLPNYRFLVCHLILPNLGRLRRFAMFRYVPDILQVDSDCVPAFTALDSELFITDTVAYLVRFG